MPSTSSFTRGSARARRRTSSSFASRGTVMRPRTLPFTCTASSRSSSRATAGSAVGQAARARPWAGRGRPILSAISSQTWGVKGHRRRTRVSTASRRAARPGPWLTCASRRWISFESSMRAATAVFRWMRSSMSAVTRSMVWWVFRRSALASSGRSAGIGPRGSRGEGLGMPVHEPPGAQEEAMRPLDAALAPLHRELGRSGEEDVEPQGVGPVLRDHVVGGDGVALRLRHHLAVPVDHALGEEPGHRLVEGDEAQVAHDLGPEARVDEVEDRVLDAAHVEVDGKPVLHRGGVEGAVVLGGREVAVEVPGRVHEGVHGVGLAPGLAPALRAGGVHERGHLVEGVAALAGEGRVGREDDRQVLLGHRLQAVLLAVDDGDGRAPVALAADEPVLEAVGHDGLANPPRLGDARPSERWRWPSRGS